MAPSRPVRPPTASKPVEPGFIGPVSPLVNRPTLPATPAPPTADQQALADLMLVQGQASQPQQPPPAGGTEDLMAWMQDETPTGQSVTLPSGTTMRTDLVPLGNKLIGETTTATLPAGSPTVVSTPGVAISPEQMAGLFATDAAYTPADRDRDLALLNGRRGYGPYTEAGAAAEAAARQAATARLNAHWDQSALPAFTDGSIVVPGLDYSAVQLANDLSVASTTGNLDDRSTQLRREAQQRLEKNAYTKKEQDDDQIAAQIHYLPPDDPRIKDLRAQGLSPAQAQNVIFQRSLAARDRLDHAHIELLSPAQVKQLENKPRLYAADPNNPGIPYDIPDEPGLDLDHHNLDDVIGDFIGLNDLTEGIVDGNVGQALWGGVNTALTLAEGPIGKGVSTLAGKVGARVAKWVDEGLEVAPEALRLAEAEVAAQKAFGVSPFPIQSLPGAAQAFPDVPTPFLADGPLVGSRPGIVDYPKPEELPSYTHGIEAPVAVAPRTIPPVRGPGLLSSPLARFDESGLPIGMLEDPIVYMGGPKPGRPGDIIPRRSPGEHVNVRSNSVETLIPWTGKTDETPIGYWPVGVYASPKTGQWYRRVPGQSLPKTVDMPSWAKGPSDTIMFGKLVEDPIAVIRTGLPGYEQRMLDEINVLQNHGKAARDQAELELEGFMGNHPMRIKNRDGTFRELTIDDLSKKKLRETLNRLRNQHQYGTGDVDRLEILASDLSTRRGAVTDLSERRGEIGGDYFAAQAGIEIIHRGSGKYTADRVGVFTDAAGNKRVVLLEYKGGAKPNSLSSRGDVNETGVGGEIRVEQGTFPYAQDEFLRKDSEALQALRDYDPQLAQRLLDGEDFDYVLVHTEPGTNKITAYEFDPGTAKSFHLTQPESALTPTPAAGVGAPPIAPPQWITDLRSSGLNNLNTWTALALPALAPLTGLAWLANTDEKVDQSMVVNISMPQPPVTDVDPREAGKVLTYGAHIR
ncbi:hypothetical protein [Rhodococcus sp. Q]|uniref:hypothetical protein n=1 Tax=Rhodococcus sp. Q TaxID=2502252 RepID=UPI0010F5F004|nr:hypothetical protein [Rhodococcus sp. Q]